MQEVTIYDIAKLFNVAPSTVSRALKGDPNVSKATCEKIQKKAEELGYQKNAFASKLRSKQTFTIGVVIPKLNSQFMSNVIAGMESKANANGYQIIITQSEEKSEKEKNAFRTLFQSRVDGLLVSLANETTSFEHFEPYQKKKLPIVLFDRREDDLKVGKVGIDNKKATLDATNHLIEQGCRRIAYIGGDNRRALYRSRLEGYTKAIHNSASELDENLIFESDLYQSTGEEIVEKLIKENIPFDGIVSANDWSAIGAILTLRKHAIAVPNDVAVVGFNDDPACSIISPKLSTIRYPAFKLGELAIGELIQRIARSTKHEESSVILKHELICRESSVRK